MEVKKRKSIKDIPTETVVLWVSIVSLIMLFAALTSGYIVRRAEGNWNVFSMPVVFWFSTAVILLTSFTMNKALTDAKSDKMSSSKTMLIISFVLGVVFCVIQYFGLVDLAERGIYFTGAGHNSSGSWLILLTVLHVVHLFAGLIALGITLAKGVKDKYSSSNYLGISLCATYWHFLDLLWVYLFIFLLLFR